MSEPRQASLMNRLLLYVCAGAMLAGCSSALTPEEEAARRWAREVRILRPGQLGDRPHEVLTGLEERVRIGAMGEEDAVREAERELRLRAARVDADAVVVEFCGRTEDPREPMTASVPTVICQGLAIRWTGP